LQALQRCSGLLNLRARGSTVATHYFGGGTRIEKFIRSLACPARRIKLLPSASSSVSFQRSRSSMYRAPRFERGGCRRNSCREHHSFFPRRSPTSRGTPLRPEPVRVQLLPPGPLCGSCRYHIAPVAQRRGSGLKPRPVSVRVRPGAHHLNARVVQQQRHPPQKRNSASANLAAGTNGT
jgi:hypothetical protein